MELRDQSLTPQEVQETANLENEAAPAAETVKTDCDTTETGENTPGERPERHRQLSKEEIIEALEKLSALEADDIQAEDVARLKQQFYQLRNDEIRAEREAFEAIEGNDPATFTPTPDPAEEKVKELLNVVKERKPSAAPPSRPCFRPTMTARKPSSRNCAR